MYISVIGQQCKYQLLSSRGCNFFYCSKKIYEGIQISLKFCTHIHLGIMKLQLNLQQQICFIYRVNPVLYPDTLTQVYNKLLYSKFTLSYSLAFCIQRSIKILYWGIYMYFFIEAEHAPYVECINQK